MRKYTRKVCRRSSVSINLKKNLKKKKRYKNSLANTSCYRLAQGLDIIFINLE